MQEKKERYAAARIRRAILEGYQDAICGRSVAYHGNLRRLLDEAAPEGQSRKTRDQNGRCGRRPRRTY